MTNLGRLTLFQYTLLIIIPIIFWRFYNFIGFSERSVKLLLFITVPLLFVFLWKKVLITKYTISSFSFWMKMFILSTLISIINSLIFWEQSFMLSYRVMAVTFHFLFFFILLKYKVKYEEIIKLVYVFVIIYILLYLYALYQLPMNVFGRINEEVNEDRGFFRISILSIEFIIISLFYTIYLLKHSTGKKTLKIISFIILYVFIILTLSRTIIVVVSIIGLSYLIWGRNMKKNIFISLIFFSTFFLLSGPLINIFENSKIGASLLEQTKIDLGHYSNERNEAGLRITEFKIAFSEYNQKSLLTILFGNGRSHVHSKFGRYESTLESFNRSDSTLPSLYITHGIFGILIFFILIIKSFVLRYNLRSTPFKLFIICSFFIGLFSEVYIHFGIGLCISLYVLELDRRKCV